jgi:hypothetical protein
MGTTLAIDRNAVTMQMQLRFAAIPLFRGFATRPQCICNARATARVALNSLSDCRLR